MSKKPICWMALLLLICLSPGLRADDSHPGLVFICHKGLNYSEAVVKYAYKGYLDEPRPVDNRPLFQTMLKFIGYTPAKYKKVWNKMYFRRALFVPKMLNTDEEVIRWVATNEEGLGYVSTPPTDNPNVEVCGNS